MIKSLNSQSFEIVNSRFLLVGGGTVGLILGWKLAKLDIGKVVVLEAGGTGTYLASGIFPNIEFTRSVYGGATSGRFAGLGGTSARWGGAMLPFMESDFRGEFRDLISEASKFTSQVEDIFSLPSGPYECNDSINIPNYISRKAKWPKFSNRNVAKLLSKELKNEKNLIIYTNARVTNLNSEDSRILSVTALNNDSNSFTFSAEDYILCAGAIETTRMILELEAKTNKNLNESIVSTTGKYFSDHLSVKIGTLAPISKKKLNKIVGYRFGPRGSMSNIRFELDGASSYRDSIPPHFIHISFALGASGGFQTLREILRNLQERKIPPFILYLELCKFLPWLIRAVWWRYITKRLLYPKNAEIEMHLVIEQCPNLENRISLLNHVNQKYDESDFEISWGVSNEDQLNLKKILELVKNSYAESDLSKLAEIKFLDTDQILRVLDSGEGIFHPTGSTRVAVDGNTGTVDSNLKVSEFENLYLVSTSVLISGGGANPTMTELMLGLRLVDHFKYLDNQVDRNLSNE